MKIKAVATTLLLLTTSFTIVTPAVQASWFGEIFNGEIQGEVDPRDPYEEELKRQEEIQQERIRQLEEQKKAGENKQKEWICRTKPKYCNQN